MCLGMGIVRSECGDWAHSMRFFVILGTLLLLCPLYEDSAFAEAAEHQAIEFRAEEMTRGDDQANKEAHLRSEVAVNGVDDTSAAVAPDPVAKVVYDDTRTEENKQGEPQGERQA